MQKKTLKRQTLGKKHPYLFSQSEPVSEKQNDSQLAILIHD